MSVAQLSSPGCNGLLVLLLVAIGVMLRLPMPPRNNGFCCTPSHRIYRAVRFALRDVAQLALHSAQAAVACCYLRRR